MSNITLNADEDVEQEELSFIVRMRNGTTNLKDVLAVSYITKHTHSI